MQIYNTLLKLNYLYLTSENSGLIIKLLSNGWPLGKHKNIFVNCRLDRQPLKTFSNSQVFYLPRLQ